MKINIRNNVFETNSSSVHTLCICTEDEYEKFKNGELLYDLDLDILTPDVENKWGDGNITYNEFWGDEDEYDYYDGCLETYYEEYTSPSGDKIVIFGKYGHD